MNELSSLHKAMLARLAVNAWLEAERQGDQIGASIYQELHFALIEALRNERRSA